MIELTGRVSIPEVLRELFPRESDKPELHDYVHQKYGDCRTARKPCLMCCHKMVVAKAPMCEDCTNYCGTVSKFAIKEGLL